MLEKFVTNTSEIIIFKILSTKVKLAHSLFCIKLVSAAFSFVRD